MEIAMQISDMMTDHHHECDNYFASAENAVVKDNWAEAEASFLKFRTALLLHLRREEEVLFPAFEAETGQTVGPTRMMRMEHEQMREILEKMIDACNRHNRSDYIGNSETLMVLMQQHNMKEEHILYPMIDQALESKSDKLITKITELVSV